MHARLRRRLSVRVPATVFVPAEGVLARLTASEKMDLLAQGGCRLAAAVRAHIAEGHHRLARGDWLAPSAAGAIRAGDGSRYAAAVRGAARIVAGPIHLDGIEIYIIDRPLTPLALNPSTVADATVALARSLRHRASRVTVRTKAGLVRQLQRNDRLYRLVLKIRIALDPRLRESDAATRARSSPEMQPALAAYRRGLAWRALDAMRQLYTFYQTAVLTGTAVTVAPATRLGQAAAASSRACDELADAVRQSPNFAEAWLELGFARLAAAEPAVALEAFARASTLPPMLARTHSDPDPRTVAVIERARLLARESGPAAALAVLDAAPLARPVPWALHDLRASLLLKAGSIDEALEAFELGMRQDYIHPSFGAQLPRDLAMLEATVGIVPDVNNAPERAEPPHESNARIG